MHSALPLHDRIEVRICSNESTENEDTPVEVLEYSICAIGLLVYTCAFKRTAHIPAHIRYSSIKTFYS